MKTDFKFWYIKKDDNGFIVEAAIRFYEGDITTENEMILDKSIEDFISVPITRYRRTKRLQETELKHLKSKKVVKESSGKDCILYTQEDFGKIKTDGELRLFLNSELKKDSSRIPIKEQE